jgi:hypothetical protein
MRRIFVALLLVALTVPAWGAGKPICPNGVEESTAIFDINPYDSVGRCFYYAGYNMQLQGRTTGLYIVAPGIRTIV